jgi:hypothetical protein
MLTPTPGVTQNMPYSKVQRDFSSCNLAKGERVIKTFMLKKHRKNVLLSKSIEKKE